MKKDDKVYLRHVLDAIAQVEDYLKGTTAKKFLQTRLLQDAVVRQLEIIGEASRYLSNEFHERHPEIPWGQIIGLRNRLIHAYFSINFQTIWEIIEHDLPSLKQNVERLLEEMEKGDLNE